LIRAASFDATCASIGCGCFPVGAAANRVGGLAGFTTHSPKITRFVVAIAWFALGEGDSDGANATFFAFVERRSAALGGRGEWQ
jgi:hypothetical protein